MARFRTKPLTLEPGERGQSEVRGEARAPLTAADGRDRARAAHRLRQHRQPAAGARRRARRRDGGAAVDRREPRGRCWASCWSSRARWRCSAGWPACSSRAGRWAALPRCCRPRRRPSIPAGARRARCCSSRSGCRLRTGLALRPLSGAAQHAAGPGRRAQGPRRPAVGGPRRRRGSAPVLATSQIALSMALLVAAGLFTKSLYNVSRVDLGLADRQARHLRGVAVAERLHATRRRSRFFERVEDDWRRCRASPASAPRRCRSSSGNNWNNSVRRAGLRGRPRHQHHGVVQRSRPGLLPDARDSAAGRAASSRAPTAPSAPKVAIVNQAFARKFNLGRPRRSARG